MSNTEIRTHLGMDFYKTLVSVVGFPPSISLAIAADYERSNRLDEGFQIVRQHLANASFGAGLGVPLS